MKSFNIITSNGQVNLTSEVLPNDLNLDLILTIDPSNITGDCLITPLLLNKLGILKAEAENALETHEFESNILEANLAQAIRKESDGKKLTIKELDDQLLSNNNFRAAHLKRIELKKMVKIVDSAYRACISKDTKLSKMLNIAPEDCSSEVLSKAIQKAINRNLKN